MLTGVLGTLFMLINLNENVICRPFLYRFSPAFARIYEMEKTSFSTQSRTQEDSRWSIVGYRSPKNLCSSPETLFKVASTMQTNKSVWSTIYSLTLEIPPGKMLRCAKKEEKRFSDGFERNKKHSPARNYYAGLSLMKHYVVLCWAFLSTIHMLFTEGSLAQCIIMRSDINDVIYGWRRSERLHCLLFWWLLMSARRRGNEN